MQRLGGWDVEDDWGPYIGGTRQTGVGYGGCTPAFSTFCLLLCFRFRFRSSSGDGFGDSNFRAFFLVFLFVFWFGRFDAGER